MHSMKSTIIVACIIFISSVAVAALDDGFQNAQAFEIALGQDSNQLVTIIDKFDDIINQDDSPSVADITVNEMNNNLNYIINSKTYATPDKISLKDTWLKDLLEGTATAVQNDNSPEVVLINDGVIVDADLMNSLDSMFAEITVSNVESSNEKDLVDAFIITDMQYEESVVYSVGSTD